MSLTLPPSLRPTTDDRAVRQIAKYYSRRDDGSALYTGARYDTFDPTGGRAAQVDRFTPDDIVAISFLSVRVRPSSIDTLLYGRAEEINGVLEEVGHEPFWEAGPPSSGTPQWRLEDSLRSIADIGMTKASKLMARKRPELIPIYDSVVAKVLEVEKPFWGPMYELFANDSFRDRLASIRDTVRQEDPETLMPADLTLLRVFDVVTWMDGRSAGVPSASPDEL